MNKFLSCPPNGTICTIVHLNLYILVIAAVILLIAWIGNIIWWKRIVKQITVDPMPMPSRYPTGIGINISNDSEYDLLDFSIQPLQIKTLTWPSNLNTSGGLEYYQFDTKKDRIRDFGKALEGLAKSYGNENEGYKTKILVIEGGFVYHHYYFTLYETNKDSPASEKGHGDVKGAIYQIFIEVRGKIGEGKVSKIFRGKFYHLITCRKWDNKKRGWVVNPNPKYISDMNWIDFDECTMKEFKKAKKKTEEDQKNPSMAKAEILTKDEFLNALQPAPHKEKAVLTRGGFFKALDRVIQLVPSKAKPPKKETSE